jgi:hypothetical protein
MKPCYRFISVLLFSLILTGKNGFAATDPSTVGLTNYAFASYLGNGFYTTSGQRVFVLQIPLKHTIKELSEDEAGIVLKLPLTFGIVDFEALENIPEVNDITTMTFLPGLEYQYPVTPDWTLSPFFDYGFARDFNNAENVLITGIGIKSYFDFTVYESSFTLGNRFLYAREQSKTKASNSDYSLIETGLNYRVDSDYVFSNGPLQSNLYYLNLYYPNNLVFLEQTDNPIRVGVEHEVGITISNIPDFLFFDSPQIGLGVRVGGDVNVYRLVFGAPF